MTARVACGAPGAKSAALGVPDLHIVMCVGEAKLSICAGKRRENRQKGGKEAQHTGKDHCFSQYVLGTAYPEPPFLTSREKVQKKSGLQKGGAQTDLKEPFNGAGTTS